MGMIGDSPGCQPLKREAIILNPMSQPQSTGTGRPQPDPPRGDPPIAPPLVGPEPQAPASRTRPPCPGDASRWTWNDHQGAWPRCRTGPRPAALRAVSRGSGSPVGSRAAPAAMGLELYLDLLSQPCRAVYIFAKKNGVPFELRTVELLKGQHLSDDFAQVNPLKKVPALKDGDFTLTESVAILLYLTRKFKVPDHWYPQELQARARVDEYLAWQHTTLRRNCLRTLWHKIMFPVFLGEPVSPETLAATLAELDATLQILEDNFLQNKAFLVGPHISLADLVAVTELMHPVGAGCQIFESRPKLAAWRQRVEAAVGSLLFQEAHEVILKASDLPPADPSVKQKLMPRVLAMMQ